MPLALRLGGTSLSVAKGVFPRLPRHSCLMAYHQIIQSILLQFLNFERDKMTKILDKFKLDGKVAVITGAARGLGQGMAVALAEAGSDITVVDMIDCSETLEIIKKLGRKAIAVQLDLCAQARLRRLLTKPWRSLAAWIYLLTMPA